MSTPQNQRPSADNRTPAELARELAQMACAPAATFGGLLDDNDTERDRQYQRLLTRLIADWPDMWSRAKEDDVDERLRVSLSTNEDRELFNQHVDHLSTRGTVREEAAYLVGIEVGRQSGGSGKTGGIAADPPVSGTAPPPTTTDDLNVDDLLITVIGRIWLAIATVHAEIGDVADVNEYGWHALSDLLKQMATDLEAARGQYCTEFNAMYDAAKARGAA